VETSTRITIVTLISEEDERSPEEIKQEVRKMLKIASITKRWHIERVAVLEPGNERIVSYH
jgi:hypothetical protein